MSRLLESHGRDLLKRELEKRCRKNPRYSLRAFAKSLGLSHTVVSLVLAGKRELSERAAIRVAESLSLSPSKRRALVTSSNLHHRRGTSSSQAAKTRDDQYEQLSMDVFCVISEWYYYAILSLLELPESKLDAKWISSRIGISEIQARLATECLIRLGLIREVAPGHWRQSGKPIKFENTDSIAATRRFYKQLLDKASHSIDHCRSDERDMSSMTLAMDASLIPYARERINQFRRELTMDLEARGKPDSVFELMIQLFPLTRCSKQENV